MIRRYGKGSPSAMYIPNQFREERPEVLQAFIARHPLAALIAVTAKGMTANHIPMLWSPRPPGLGVLQGHVARANSIWNAVAADAPVLAIFGGGSHYITPNWYPAKHEHGKVVPTWNYSVVHAHRTIRFIDDDHPRLHRHVSELTDHNESSQSAPWKVTDAPPEYVESLLSNIVFFEIAVQRLIGKFKCSQHRDELERQSVLTALAAEGMNPQDRSEIIRMPGERPVNSGD